MCASVRVCHPLANLSKFSYMTLAHIFAISHHNQSSCTARNVCVPCKFNWISINFTSVFNFLFTFLTTKFISFHHFIFTFSTTTHCEIICSAWHTFCHREIAIKVARHVYVYLHRARASSSVLAVDQMADKQNKKKLRGRRSSRRRMSSWSSGYISLVWHYDIIIDEHTLP